MKNTFLKILCNTYIKQSPVGYSSPLHSCKRCISHSVPQGQGLVDTQDWLQLQDHDTSQALNHEDYFDVKKLVSLQELFLKNVHLGHHKGCRDIYMSPYLFGTRRNIDIFDLEQTVPLLQDALNFTAHIAYRGGVILFVSRNKALMPYIENTAKSCGEYAHCRYWQPNLFTDMPKAFGQRIRLPDICIFMNTLNSVFESHRGVIDCAKMLIPTVGIVDSNCDPRLITYPIPGNDDSFGAMSLYLNLFKTAILEGKKKRAEETQQALEEFPEREEEMEKELDDGLEEEDDLPSI